MHLMRKNARDKVSFAPVPATTAAETTSKTSSPTAKAKERASLMAALFTSKVMPPPPPPPRSPVLSSVESSPEKFHHTKPGSSAESSPAKSSSLDSTFARGLRKELSKRLAEPVATVEDHHDESLASDDDDDDEFLDGDDGHDDQTKTLQSAKQLERQLQVLTQSSAEGEEAWRRENARLREQLAAASKREGAQMQQLKSYEAQLAGCKQELEQLRKLSAVAAAQSPPPSPVHSTNDALLPSMRERELLRLVIALVGKDSVRALLRDNPHAVSADLRHALAQLRLKQQQQRYPQAPPSPPYRSPSERSNSPLRDPYTTTTKPQRHARDTSPTDGSSPALDAIYEKFWKDDV